MDIILKPKPDRIARRRSRLVYIGVAITAAVVAGAILLAFYLGERQTGVQPGESVPLALPPHPGSAPANPTAQSGKAAADAADIVGAPASPTRATSPSWPAVAQAPQTPSLPNAGPMVAQNTPAEPVQTATESRASTTASSLQPASQMALNAFEAPSATANAAELSAPAAPPSALDPKATDPIKVATRSPNPTTEARSLEDWLASRSDDHYTIQLIAGHERQTLERYLDQHPMGDKAHVVRTQYRGRDWHVLVTGDYPSRDAAHNAMNRFPQALRDNGLWVRSFASLRP